MCSHLGNAGLDKFSVVSEKEKIFLTASRMVPYKRIDIIVKAFAAMPDKRLVVIGDGPEFKRLKEIAGPNVTMLGFQGDAVLRDHMQRARAFIFAAHEDQGLIPIEAQACGTPVIAYRKGGASETVIGIDNKKNDLPTGLFFDAQTPESIVDAIGLFEIVEDQIKPEICRKNAERFSVENFSRTFSAVIDEAMNTVFKDDKFEIASEQRKHPAWAAGL